MALGQTLALPIILCTPRNPLITSLSLNPNPSSVHSFSSPSQTPNNSRRFTAVKCSLDYDSIDGNSNNYNDNDNYNYNYNNNGHDGRQEVPQYPRPSEIPWQREICNTVHLIGKVSSVVQIRYLPGEKTAAFCRIAVKKTPIRTSSILLTFWNELAHVAFQHLEKGRQIYVCGRLVADEFETDGQQRTYYKVTVKQLNFIEPFSSSDGDSNSAVSGSKPDYASTNTSREELWQAFFANPADWWDNRKAKSELQRHPRYPDFKHKHTGESLWVDAKYNPPWLKSQLEILDARREAFAFPDQNDGMNMNFGDGSNYSAF